MRIIPTALPGVLLLESETHEDRRGSFVRLFDETALAAADMPFAVTQVAFSENRVRGTVRGLHYQAEPRPEAKIVCAPRGRIFDVALDLRPDSPTRGQHVAVELHGARALLLPPGCAHGFQTLEDGTLVCYLISEGFDGSLQRGVRWDDPALGIAWPLREGVVLSERDRGLPLYAEITHV